MLLVDLLNKVVVLRDLRISLALSLSFSQG
jgi:hypothetical protein